MSRYIDADKHLQKLRERRDTAIIWEINCNDEATKDRAQEAILIFNECISELIDAPTADVRENVRGKWIPHPNKQNKEWDICSACGIGCKRREYGIHANGKKWVTEYNFPFCPNCGADMRSREGKHADITIIDESVCADRRHQS